MVSIGPVLNYVFNEGYAEAVSADGSTVVGYDRTASTSEPTRWTTENGLEYLGHLPGASADARSSPQGISADGQTIVGNTGALTGGGPWRWTPESGMVRIETTGGDAQLEYAVDVSADGSVILGGRSFGSGSIAIEPVLWTSDGTATALGGLHDEFVLSLTESLSADGSTVVGQSLGPNGLEAFRWTVETGMVGLGDLPGGRFRGRAYDASEHGSIIVGYSEVTYFSDYRKTKAFVWDEGNGMRSIQDLLTDEYGLDLNGWWLTEARAVSDDGLTFVGTGINPDGNTEAWIATVPEPGTLAMLALTAGIALNSRHARRRRDRLIGRSAQA
jgi:uncharacterized membrane protein